MEPSTRELELLRQRISRRRLLTTGAAAALGAAGIGLAACDGEGKDGAATPPATAAPAATEGPATTPTSSPMLQFGLGGDPAGITEVAPGTIFFPYFGNVIALLTDEGIVLIDTSLSGNGAEVLEELRKRTESPIHTIVYTHGHLDHVGGVDHFINDANQRGHPRPRVVAHRRVVDRLRRYERMWGHIVFTNSIQFGVPREPGFEPPQPPSFVYPDETYDGRTALTVGGERFELVHGVGETDDHTWVWAPRRNLACAGDFFVWSCPNVGNPWKVQRYAEGWAEGLEAMADVRPRLLLPGHGPPIEGEEAVQSACLAVARYLRSIHDQVIERMNRGQWLEQILSEVKPPADLVDNPYLASIYGHPTFIIHGVWRQYGGWYEGDPADFFPASSADQAAEIVKLAGAGSLLARAREIEAAGDPALACHLVDWVLKARPQDREAWQLWRDLFQARTDYEGNFMARNVFRGAVHEAERQLERLYYKVE